MTQVSNTVIDKIRKCLALASGKNATQGEMENAMAKAKEIALRYNIELGSVEMNPEANKSTNIEVKTDISLTTSTKYLQPYHRWIWQVLQEVFEVRVLVAGHWEYNGKVISRIWLIGEATDVEIAKVMFSWLEKTYPSILRKGIKSGVLRERMADINGCYRGITSGILSVNRRAKEALTSQENQCMALVVRRKEDLIQAKMDEMFPNVGKARASHSRYSYEGIQFGVEEGSKLNLRQVSATSKKTEIQ